MQDAVTVASLLTNVSTFVTSGLPLVWTAITSNELLQLFCGMSLFSSAVWVFRKVKGAARH